MPPVLRCLSLLFISRVVWSGAEKPAPRLDVNDEITIHVVHMTEFPKEPVRVGRDGFVDIPLVGRLRVQGSTTTEVREVLKERLKDYLQEPDVTVTLAKRRTFPVSVIGAVGAPGVLQLTEPHRLIEVLSLAGGTKEDAGTSLKITRRLERGSLPLPAAKVDETGQFSVAEIDLDGLIRATNPAENILVLPDDVISVPRADLVYVLGEVKKPGGFTLRAREKVRVLQALAMAEGLTIRAGAKNAKIMRVDPKRGERIEIPVDLRKVLDGGAPDLMMEPEDILVVPNSAPRSAALRGAEAALQVATGVIIWRR
jgi:polysaccharide export outer membrane protein